MDCSRENARGALRSNGVTEARDPSGVELGECTLARLLAEHRGDDADLARALVHDVLRFADGELRDDLVLLTLTRLQANRFTMEDLSLLTSITLALSYSFKHNHISQEK